LGGHVTSAHVADTTEFPTLLTEASLPEGSFICAGKGDASAKNRSLLTGHGDAIMHKAARNRPLTVIERCINRLISSIRYRVEQTLGTFKRLYGFSRMRYRGTPKGNMELHLIGTAFNLKKAAAMVE
jgi:transposase, IS5 family